MLKRWKVGDNENCRKRRSTGSGSTVFPETYMATAETLNPCQVNFIKREDFMRFLKENGAACLRVAEHLSNNHPRRGRAVRSLDSRIQLPRSSQS